MDKYDDTIARLARRLKQAGVDRETAVNISLRVRKSETRTRMIEWLDQNPEASVIEICEKSRELHKLQNRFAPEEIKAAEEKIAKLEESGFFLLCGCSMGQPDAHEESLTAKERATGNQSTEE